MVIKKINKGCVSQLTVPLPFILKSILRQKEEEEFIENSSNISTMPKIIIF